VLSTTSWVLIACFLVGAMADLLTWGTNWLSWLLARGAEPNLPQRAF